MKTDTAHAIWNSRWATEQGRADWLKPEPDVMSVTEALMRRSGDRLKVLDLGCGVGRHALYFASLGFDVTAVDMAESGLDQVRRAADAARLTITTGVVPMTELPFEDGAFDYVLSFNVIYHGDGNVVRSSLAEIARVLQPGGTYQGTMLSKRNSNYGVGREISPNTFVVDAPVTDRCDKIHPHFYCDAGELAALLRGFELLDLMQKEHASPGTWHWHLEAEKL